jgi:hypothetical protein
MIVHTQSGSRLKRANYVDDDEQVVSDRNVVERDATTASAPVILANIVRVLYGFLAVMLGLRVFLSLFAADTTNSFAMFVYSFTRPFVRPFQGLFGIDTSIANGSRFEIETLVAIVVYGLATWVIISLLLVTKRRRTTTEL